MSNSLCWVNSCCRQPNAAPHDGQADTFPSAPTGYNPNHSEKKKERHTSANFSEAWVEFLDKNVAKTVANMLNAQVIGGKKGDR